MRFVDIIEKKKQKKSLSKEEIKIWIQGLVEGSIPDYQSSALLMAIVLNGMTQEETTNLAEAMVLSGEQIDLSNISGVKVDKHSTGGVGDKTTLVLGPLVASCGLKVAKMSGRGLGHTGGTLDKLESIPGFDCFLTTENFVRQVEKIGIALVGQTADLVPADKKLYALRDVTATVESIPLIASSIMSKKLAFGSDTILLDVKFGEGAFMKTIEEGKELASSMIKIGKSLGRDTRAILTEMDQPLGNTIGNALEVIEAIETLQGKGPEDFTELCITSAELMLLQGKIVSTKEEAREMLWKKIDSGEAFEKFCEVVREQKGDVQALHDISLFPQAKNRTELKSQKTGYVVKIHSQNLGFLSMEIGAGREKKEDDINPAVGLKLHKKYGDFVEVGESLCAIYHDNPLEENWKTRLLESFEIQEGKPKKKNMIEAIIEE
ncbi:pyrimidine-nucleoside phosphorylase [Fusobacterium gonidiaformans]|uniref:pyrimidine-nucleoside phosphorylase n=1 Tax=Fusobacterium gonidiaformans TaxID=849 RepID=UPI0001BC66AF|nr:pyrimidine-nucleoside phosphorylase [Fusobacterium gonidiaformans]AVQ16061.1 pyrimidine-nucleoside phosphorylase [Fusobacterium gonidiaformans ATCC 25563]EFS28716.1 pyrimidine-nucleoside phosphorylase [Fusobacterium gonidiaformans ATCC 25563]